MWRTAEVQKKSYICCSGKSNPRKPTLTLDHGPILSAHDRMQSQMSCLLVWPLCICKTSCFTSPHCFKAKETNSSSSNSPLKWGTLAEGQKQKRYKKGFDEFQEASVRISEEGAINYIAWKWSPAVEIVCQKLHSRGWSLCIDIHTWLYRKIGKAEASSTYLPYTAHTLLVLLALSVSESTGLKGSSP